VQHFGHQVSKNSLTVGSLLVLISLFFSGHADVRAATDLSVKVTGLSASTVKLGNRALSSYEGQYLVLSNGSDELEIQDNTAGETLSSGLVPGDTYNVEIKNQPYLGSQVCSVDEAQKTGAINDSSPATITVDVTCSEVKLTIGGTVTGIEGGPMVELVNNAREKIYVGDGSFTFSDTEYWQGGAYSVTVETNPPGKTCTLDNWYGVATEDVTDIEVTCVPESAPQAEVCVSTDDELQDALSAAAQDDIDNVIKVEKGTYTGAFYYSASETDGLTLALQGGYDTGCASRSFKPDATIFDGENVRRPIYLNSQGDVLFQRFTVRNGFHRSHREYSDAGATYRPNLGGSGGALRAVIFGGGSFRLESNVFEDNVSETNGGAAFIFVSTGNLDIVNNLFVNNLAGPKSPILLLSDDGSESKFGPSGGAVWLNVGDGKADLVQNTFVDNYAKTGLGGGIRVSMNADDQESYSRLYNNLFFDNKTSGQGFEQNGSFRPPEEEGNDIWMQYDVGSDFEPEQPPVLVNNRFDDRDPEGIFTDFQFDVNLAVDPGFVDRDSGDFRLAPDSPLVDAGLLPAGDSSSQVASFRMGEGGSQRVKPQTKASLPADVSLPNVDLNGSARTAGASVDVGAYETQADGSSPEPGLSTNAISFESSILSGTATTQALTLTNQGSGVLFIEDLTITGRSSSDFEIVSDGCSEQSLSAGESCTIEIRALTTNSGTLTATLNISTNNGVETVSLKAEVLPPVPVPTVGLGWLIVLASLLVWFGYRCKGVRAQVA